MRDRDPDRPDLDRYPELARTLSRREMIKSAAAGAIVMALGGALYRIVSDDVTRKAMAEPRADGKKKLPPGQRAIEKLKPMGGEEGPGDVKSFKLRVHGLVKTELELDYAALLKLPQVERSADVHCVTGWSLLDGVWKGVQIATLADKAGVKSEARHVILEAAHGFTSNAPLAEATGDNALVTYRLNGKPFALQHGAPVRGLVPDLYFWKSAKWIGGMQFLDRDRPGFWETYGYHIYGDPWKEERYS